MVELTIELPYSMLIEQVNLLVDQPTIKKQSVFSQGYQLVSIAGDQSELALKTAYSECVTRNGKLEYNVVGVAKSLKFIFSAESDSSPI